MGSSLRIGKRAFCVASKPLSAFRSDDPFVRDDLFGSLRLMRTLAFKLWLIVGVALLLHPGMACSGQTQPKHRVTLEDQETLKESLYMQLSPTGNQPAYFLNKDTAEPLQADT